MQHKLALYLGLLFYSVIAAAFLIFFDAAFITAVVSLFFVPIAWWWHELYPSKFFIYSALAIALSATLFFESLAHLSGAWYRVGEGVFRLFGLFPLESFFVLLVQFVFVVFLHEFFVDDKKMHYLKLNSKRKKLLIFTGLVGACGIVLPFIFSNISITYGFWWILTGFLVVTAGASFLAHRSPKHIIEKALLTAVLALPIFLLFEAVSVFNIYTVYANTSQYLYSFNFWGETVPIEKILELFFSPIWIVAIYELYFDDAK